MTTHQAFAMSQLPTAPSQVLREGHRSMTESTPAASAYVRFPRNELDALFDAVKHYRFAYMDTRNDAWGQAGVRDWCASATEEERFCLYLWFGLNHQRIKAGDTVRVYSSGDTPPYNEAEVLAVSTYAALVDNELSGVEWAIWPTVHRMDRLHTEPDFDHTHYVPVSRHMGYDTDAESIADYERICATRPAAAPKLTIVKESAGE